MSRISLLLVALAVASGVVGCAQCDTCDDFPAPCTGPNCGQSAPGILDYMPPGEGQPVQAPGSSAPASSAPAAPMNDAAGPAPVAPPTPMVNPAAGPTM